jgi:deoxyribodipyrimidine photo-lyase
MAAPVIHWFRQDLRIAGNPALAAAAAAGPVIPVFILDDQTPDKWKWGGASRWWLHRSLESLSQDVPLVLKRGAADKVLAGLIRETGAKAIYFTRDYAPWASALEDRVKQVCEATGAECRRFGGFLLHEPEAIRTGAGQPFKVYTPFSRACFALGDPKPPAGKPTIEIASGLSTSDRLEDWSLLPSKPNWAGGFETVWQPGEAGAKKRLADFLENGLAGYADGRDFPKLEVVSRLSPHLHWGEISPAQVWTATRAAQAEAGGKLDAAAEKFLKEVLWREFSYHLIYHWPGFPEKPFRPEFEDFPWADDSKSLRAWQKGMTGYPIVDAGMRELWVTGIMHNRVRMIVASFLIKHLLLPWQKGEEWFWDTLVDADIGNNSASWQWVAGCGADATPYFRIFNPILQGIKFDGDGTYVRRWVPELARMPDEFVHKPWEAPALVLREAGVELGKTYPSPIVEHQRARDRALEAFKSLKGEAA